MRPRLPDLPEDDDELQELQVRRHRAACNCSGIAIDTAITPLWTQNQWFASTPQLSTRVTRISTPTSSRPTAPSTTIHNQQPPSGTLHRNTAIDGRHPPRTASSVLGAVQERTTSGSTTTPLSVPSSAFPQATHRSRSKVCTCLPTICITPAYLAVRLTMNSTLSSTLLVVCRRLSLF